MLTHVAPIVGPMVVFFLFVLSVYMLYSGNSAFARWTGFAILLYTMFIGIDLVILKIPVDDL